MAKFSTSNIPRPDAASGTGGRASGGSGKPAKTVKQDWVTSLQNKLVEQSKKLNAPIDLGPTGVDGVYGKKTRGAVEVVAKALKIENPLDANGRPTKEFNDKVGLGDNVAAPGTPTAPGTPAAPGSPDAPEKEGEAVQFLNDVDVDGKNISIGVLEAGLPTTMTKTLDAGGQELPLSPAEALSRFKMIRDAMLAAGFSVSSEMPNVRSLSSSSDYARASEQLETVWKELTSHLESLEKAIVAKITEKRKAMGLSAGSTQRAYKAERSTSLFPKAINAGLITAYKWLSGYLKEMEKGDETNPRPLLEVMKRNTGVAVDRNYPHDMWNDEQARKVGQILRSAGGWLGERIVPADTSQYYKGPYRDDIVDKEWTNAFKENSNEIWKIIRGQK
jgi:hypothetical protein